MKMKDFKKYETFRKWIKKVKPPKGWRLTELYYWGVNSEFEIKFKKYKKEKDGKKITNSNK